MSQIVWMDMEMTGLDINTDKIMEVSCIITDNQLQILAEEPSIVIHHPDNVLNAMNSWCLNTHTKVTYCPKLQKFRNVVKLLFVYLQTGLFTECQNSRTTLAEAENQLLEFLKNSGVPQSSAPLAGNTIYMDRMFLRKYMPLVDSYLNYRIIDVSSVKELCKRWNSRLFAKAPRKKNLHRGLDDIKESIEELRYYKPYMFRGI